MKLLNCNVLARGLWLFFLGSASSAQSTYFVDDDASASGAGTLLEPFSEISVAINQASDGDTILVQPGTYGFVDFVGKNIRLQSLEGPDATTIGPVSFASGETRAAVLHGFNIVYSTVAGYTVRCRGASPIIECNLIKDQVNDRNGGGALRVVSRSNPLVRFNEMRSNEAAAGFSQTSGFGGAIYVSFSSLELVGNHFITNIASESFSAAGGGAICAVNSTLLIRDNLFAGNGCVNQVLNTGGAISAGFCTILMEGNTFVGNGADSGQFGNPSSGGALDLLDCQTTSVNDCYWGNTADFGHEIFMRNGSLQISYSNIDLLNNGLDTGGSAGVLGTGIMGQDPLLDASFRLGPNSPLIDMGDPQHPQGSRDFDGDPRILDGSLSGVSRVDIGWDEWNPALLTVLGDGSLGSSLDCTMTGLPGQNYLLLGSLGTGDLAIGSFGSLLLRLPGLFVIGAGNVQGSESIAVPASTSLIGQTGYLQALVRIPGAGIGNFTRRVDVTFH